MKRLWSATLPCALFAGLLVTAALAGEPASLQITQALARGTEVTAYVAVRDESGQPVAAEAMGQAHATLGTQVAEVVAATPFAATGEGVLYLFLVDVSRSLDTAQFDRIRQALRDWVAALGDKDRAAVLTFGTQVRTLVAPTADRGALTAAIDGLSPSDGRTALHQALALGLTLGRQGGADLPSRRALVILSDGQDDAPGGMTPEELDAQMVEGPVPIYAIGFSRARDRAAREAGLAALGRFARRSGGLFIDASAGDPGATYAGMRERIRAVERLQVRCADCVADGNRYRLQIALTRDGRTLSDGVDVRLYPDVAVPETQAGTPAAEPPAPAPADGAPVAAPAEPQQPAGTASPAEAAPTGPAPQTDAFLPRLAAWWPWLLGAGVLALVLLTLGLTRRRSRTAPEPVVPESPAPMPVAEPLPSRPAGTRREPADQGPVLNLAFMNGARRGQAEPLVLAPDGLIGRTDGCALALGGDDEVSARHARLFVQDRRLLLEDLGSTNGTWLNGVRLLAPRPVREGDVLRCGQTELRLTGIEPGIEPGIGTGSGGA